MREDNCIFCKLANGEIPSATIYEDEDFRVFLDLNPATKGHALIVPKEHYANLFELDEELCKKVMVLAKKLGRRMKEKLGCDGLNLVQISFSSASDSEVQRGWGRNLMETGQPDARDQGGASQSSGRGLKAREWHGEYGR